MSDGDRSRPADKLKPGAGDHAIMQVGFGAILDRSIPGEAVRKIAEMHGQVKGEYPGLRVVSDATEGRWEGAAGDLPSELHGVSFEQENGDDGGGRTIRLGRLAEEAPALVASRKDHIAWAQAWENDTKRIFGLLLPPLLEHANIASLELRYHDKFIWTDGYSPLLPETLIRKGNPYFPPYIFRAGGIWKGDFDFYELPPSCPGNIQLIGSRFLVAPTSLESAKPEYEIDIYLDHGIRFREQKERVAVPAGYDEAKTSLLMNIMHDTNKRILAETLTDEALGKIKPEIS